MERYLNSPVAQDLKRKLVFLTGARQVGKTTLAGQLMASESSAAYLNYDVAADRAVIERRSWHPKSRLLVLDELHKMREWKTWLKGVVDGRPEGQQILVTGSARMDTFRQAGESLAGRFLAWRLHPISVREWLGFQPGTDPVSAEGALARLIERGGFPEPFLASEDHEADRWRRAYLDGLLREDILEFSRIHELGTMRLFVDVLRERVGSPLSLASIARDLGVAQPTLKRYLEILQALYIVFTVPPWHRNVARALLQSPKVYFLDTGLVRGDEGLRFENATATMLLKHVHWMQDARGRDAGLHYLRTKDGAEVDFALSDGDTLTHLVECKLTDPNPHRALVRFAGEWPQAAATQIVRHLRHDERRADVDVVRAAEWLAGLEA